MANFFNTVIAALRGTPGAPGGSPAPTLAPPSPDAAQTPSQAVLVPDEAVGLVKEFEGFSERAYQDPVGVWTIGYGSTRDFNGQPVSALTLPITEAQACVLVRRDMTNAALACARSVTAPLTPDQTSAIIDFIYNLGEGNFRSSTLLKKLNAKDYAGAAAEFDKWDMAGGKVLAGLLRRRQAETALFQKGA